MTPKDQELTLAQFNVMLPVQPPIRHYAQRERLEKIPEVVQQLNADVLCLNEVIPKSYDHELNQLLLPLYPYRTSPLSEILSENGGIIIFSKFPIEVEASKKFQECSGSDCFAAKGVVFARLRTDHGPVNVFATHLQAWTGPGPRRIREAQMQTLATFVQKQQLNGHEPTLLAGDLNTFGTQLDVILEKHRFQAVPYTGYTLDKHNPLAGMDSPSEYRSQEFPAGCVQEILNGHCPCCPSEQVDHVAVYLGGLPPKRASARVVKAEIRSPIQLRDGRKVKTISDHYPLVATLVFERTRESGGVSRHEDTNSLDRNVGHISLALLALAYALYFTSAVILLVYYRKRVKRKKCPCATHA